MIVIRWEFIYVFHFGGYGVEVIMNESLDQISYVIFHF